MAKLAPSSGYSCFADIKKQRANLIAIPTRTVQVKFLHLFTGFICNAISHNPQNIQPELIYFSKSPLYLSELVNLMAYTLVRIWSIKDKSDWLVSLQKLPVSLLHNINPPIQLSLDEKKT